MKIKPTNFILASGSPRRREILEDAGYRFVVLPADIDERQREGEDPKELVTRLAYEKSVAVARVHPDAVVLGADTLVSIDGHILGKPKDQSDAVKMLQVLSGRTHSVFTAFALICHRAGVSHQECHESKVTFRVLSLYDIEQYVKTGEPLDKAGAYGIQRFGAQLVREIHGSYTNIVGLNVSAVVEALRKLGIEGACEMPRDP
jgi:septum formation protein